MARGRITVAGRKGSRPASENPGAGNPEETRMSLEATLQDHTSVHWASRAGLDLHSGNSRQYLAGAPGDLGSKG